MEISNDLLCLFSADVSEADGKYVVELPRREIETGSVTPGETYRVALIAPDSGEEGTEPEESPEDFGIDPETATYKYDTGR